MNYRYGRAKNTRRGIMRERIIRVLLTEPNGTLTKYQVAKKAECSFPWTHELLKKLETLKLVRGTKVVNYRGLVKYWLDVKIKPEKREYMHRDPISLIRHVKMPYALTTYQAENLVQRYLFPSRTDIYINKEDLEKWHNLLTAEGLVGKGNLRLLIADAHVFYGSFQRQGLTVVCIPQLIVDLLEEGGVCTEAAERLIEKVNEYAV
ncbi:MAG: hypothetical protein QXU75_04395 [Candidatus Methanomethylicaceae archaeon]